MKTTMPPCLCVRPPGGRFLAALIVAALIPSAALAASASLAANPGANKSEPIPMDQLGAVAGKQYHGDGLSVSATPEGARLRCMFQRLEGEATREGLWLTSTVTNAVADRFRVVAADVRRLTSTRILQLETRNVLQSLLTSAATDQGVLPRAGTVEVAGNVVRFARPGLVEEYRVSLDGVRQDFVIAEKPDGPGELRIELAVSGARVEPAAFGAQLVLENSGRKIAYSRLRVTDATGKELTARLEVLSVGDEVTSLKSEEGSRVGRGTPCAPSRVSESSRMAAGSGAHGVTRPTVPMLAVVVQDADAVYPVRIDPTFSDANWMSMGGIPGANGGVSAAVLDGSGNLYIGGYFTFVGDVTANRVAKWNGSSWSALGSGMAEACTYVAALAVSGSDVYAGGGFTTAGGSAATNIAKWDGTNWSALGSGMEGSVRALAVSGGDLYAGGSFTTAGGSPATNIAKWNGSSWSALGSGIGGDYEGVEALAVSGSDVYAGGWFTTAGGSPATNIAKWNGSSWSALGSGMNDWVEALAVSGSNLYAAGGFTTAGGSPANHIAKWNGTTWSALGSGMDYYVRALAVSGGDLYAGGPFATAGGSPANNIAKWNGTNWSALGSGMDVDGDVSALAVAGSNVYAGGGFRTAGGVAANRIAKWNGSNWSGLGSGLGMNGSVSALAVAGSDVYAGGDFTTAGGSAANFIAKWNGSTWSALGSEMNGGVSALAVSGSDVYAGGGFTTAGGVAANGVAKWNGSSWSALGSGMGGGYAFVSALAVSGSDLYAGGNFTTAGGIATTNIAKWDGSRWSALSSGISAPPGNPYYGGWVSALAVSGSDAYAGGSFTKAGGSPATNIAKWNGTTWSALGSGMNSDVYALAVSGSDLYAGGGFTTAGGSPATNIAKWNGSSWSALGSGISAPPDDPYYGGGVSALAVSGSDLYAGGRFTTAGGSPATNIAKWNGTSWSALGSGMGGDYPYVNALAVSGSDLYAGGGFTTAGGKFSACIARAYLLPLPELSVRRSGADVMVSWPSADTAGFALEQAGTLAAPPSWITNSATVNDDGTNKSVTLPATNTSQFFRLRRP